MDTQTEPKTISDCGKRFSYRAHNGAGNPILSMTPSQYHEQDKPLRVIVDNVVYANPRYEWSHHDWLYVADVQ